MDIKTKLQDMGSSIWRWGRPTDKHKSTQKPLSTVIASNSAASSLCSIFGDEEVSDLILQGNDGGNVVAVKAILASRSPMFRRLLFGEHRPRFVPKEPDEKQILTFDDWDCLVLHLVVEYCYTDSCSVMKVQPTEDIARMMAILRIASKVFKLPGLLDKVKQWVFMQISRNPGIACAMIDEGLKNDDVDEVALQTLQLKTRASLLPDSGTVGTGVLALSKSGLLFMLRNLESTASHYLLYEAIERWVDFSSVGCSGNDVSVERTSREIFGRKCADRFIRYSEIPKDKLDILMQRPNLLTKNNVIPMSPIYESLRKERQEGRSSSSIWTSLSSETSSSQDSPRSVMNKI